MKGKNKAKKKKREALKDALKKRWNNWNPEPSKKPSSNIKSSA